MHCEKLLQFELRGYDIQATYSTTSITGKAQFSYGDGSESRNFSGGEITSEAQAWAK